MMPLPLMQWLAALRVRFWFSAYRIAQKWCVHDWRGFAWLDDYINRRRCFHIRSWWANEKREYGDFAEAVRHIKEFGVVSIREAERKAQYRKHDVKVDANGKTVGGSTSARNFTKEELKDFPEWDSQGDPWDNFLRLSKWVEGLDKKGK